MDMFMNVNWDKDLLPDYAFDEDNPRLTLRRVAVVFAAFVVFKGLYTALRTFTKLEQTTCFRVVSFTHSFQTVIANVWLVRYNDSKVLFPDSLCHKLEYADIVLCVSYGYFIYDLYKNVFIHGGLDFIAHACIVLFTLSYFITVPCAQIFAASICFFEISTLFLHSYAFLFYAGYLKLAGYSRVLFAVVFFWLRIVFGGTITYQTWQAFYLKQYPVEADCCPPTQQIIGIVTTTIFSVLNWYWFVKIVDRAMSVFRGKTKLVDKEKGLEFDAHRNAGIQKKDQ